ncbi:MAG: hypothetical protein ACI4UE_01175 [Candidatus Scatovivens sp.]
MNREEEVEVDFVYKYGNTIDGAVKLLEEYKSRGESVYINFNGQRLYSCDVTLDSAYMQVTGMTKAEDEEIRKEYIQAKTKEEKEAILAKRKGIIKGHQEEAKKNAVEVDFVYKYGNTIDGAVKLLEEYKSRGESVYINFNGQRLYSCDVTLDSAYMQVTGMTKAEDEEIRKEYIQAKTKEEKEAILAKRKSIIKGHQEETKQNATGSQDLLGSAIEATEETTKTSTINGQAQGIKDVSKGKDEKVEETEIVE